MKRRESESFQEFSDRFMKVYNSITAQFKPPIGSAQLQYVEAFDNEFTLWLSERILASLAAMMKDAKEVEVNLKASRKKKIDEGEWKREDGERIRDGGQWRRDEGEIRKDKEPEQPLPLAHNKPG